MIVAKPLSIRFDKINEFIKVYNKSRYLVLFAFENYDAICNRISYLISQKSDVTYVFSHSYAKIKVDSNDFLPIEKTWTILHNVIHIKSVFNEDQNQNYDNIFLEKCYYQLAKK